MANIVYPNTFVATTPAVASQVNANFKAITDVVNGAIEAVNLATGAVITAKLADAAVTTVKLSDGSVTNGKVATGIDAAKLANGSVSNTEFQYLDGVTSAIQTQLDALDAQLSPSYAGVVNDPDDGTVGGAAGATALPTGWSVELPDGISSNSYTVTHNLGNAAYAVVVTPIDGFNTGNPHTFHLASRDANTFELYAKTGTAVGENVSFAFILQMI